MSNNIINFKCKYKDLSYIQIMFDSNKFVIRDIIDYSNYDDFVEYLPELFIKVDFYEENILDNQDINKYNLLKKLKSYYQYFIDKIYSNNKHIEIIFKLNNKRDSIQIKVNTKLIYNQDKPIIDKLHAKYRENVKDILNSKEVIESVIKYEHVDTNNILYPFGSGGGRERCGIKAIFLHLNILNYKEFQQYTFFSEDEMYYTSSCMESFLDICKNFEHCQKLYRKFKDGTYISHTPDYWQNDIDLIEANGIYKISNANHRVCVAKRFGIPSVYAEVTTIGNIDDSNLYIGSNSIYDNKAILNHFYKTLENLQLTKENGEYILHNGLRGVDLVKYIECITGKSIYQLYKEFKR